MAIIMYTMGYRSNLYIERTQIFITVHQAKTL